MRRLPALPRCRMPDETLDQPNRPTPQSVQWVLKTLVPGYDIGEELGRGGMGVVYYARQLDLDRPVALKVILTGMAAGSSDLARFRREAKVLAGMQHPNVVQVIASGEADGLAWLSLEYCAGGTLSDRLRASPPTPREAAEIMATLAEAVDAVHAKGIIHRDLKPGNVLFTADGVLKVADFGLVREGDASGTGSGAGVGTPSYMAPEQALGRPVDARADVYALGAMLYEMLAGRPPHVGSNAQAVLAAVMTGEPPVALLRAIRPGVPAGLAAVCDRCLERDPERRCPSAAVLAADLRAWLADGEPEVARPRRLTRLAVGLLVAVALLAGVYAVRESWRSAAPTLGRGPTRPGEKPQPMKWPCLPAEARAARDEWAAYLQLPAEQDIPLRHGRTLRVALIPPGTFMMGAPPDESPDPDEVWHQVTIPYPFWIGRTEVTQTQYEAVMGTIPAKFRDGQEFADRLRGVPTDDFPVENVSWEEADAFCRKLPERGALPTEAQWEWACRAGTDTPFSFGRSLNGTRANCDGHNPFGTDVKGEYLRRPRRVGSFREYDNAFGLSDMHGNVWEWCADWFGSYPAPETPFGRARLTRGTTAARTLRGGSWYDDAGLCRSAARRHMAPDDRNEYTGFRVCLPVR